MNWIAVEIAAPVIAAAVNHLRARVVSSVLLGTRGPCGVVAVFLGYRGWGRGGNLMLMCGGLYLVRPDDHVAERGDGGACTEQPVDEAHGHRPQGAPPPRLWRADIRIYGSDAQSVSTLFLIFI